MTSRLFLLFGMLGCSTAVVMAAEGEPAMPTPETVVAAAVDDTTPPPDAGVVATRSAALELAGAFANDGYKVRDGYLTQQITPEAPLTVEVNLFAGNEYWFSAAIPPQATQKIAVTVYDRQGRIVDQQRFDDNYRVATGFEPQESGRYYVQVRLLEGSATPMTLVYSYK